MSLKNIVNRKPVTCSPETPVSEVAGLMKKNDVGAVVVVSAEKPLGIITDRDIVLRCVGERFDSNIPADKVMSKSAETVKIDEGIQHVITRMHEHKIRRIAVVDDAGKLQGLISFGDVVALIAKELKELSSVTYYPATEAEKKKAAA